MSKKTNYAIFLVNLDLVISSFDSLEDVCSLDFDKVLARMITKAREITKCASEYARIKSEE